MIEEKKIEKLFSDNQHKLDEMPSPMAWDRLEVRLEARNLSNKQSIWRRRFAIAAAVFIAVSMIGLLTYINPLGNTMNKTTALFADAEKALASEIVSSDAPTPARPILMSHREKSQYLTEASKTHMNIRPALALKKNKSKEETTNISPLKVAPSASVPAPKMEVSPSITTTDMTVETDVAPIVKEKIVAEAELAEESIVIADNATPEGDLHEVVTNEITANQIVTPAPTAPTPMATTTTAVHTPVDYDIETLPQYGDVEVETETIIALEEVAVKETKKTAKARSTADKMATAKDISAASVPAPATLEPELDRFDWLLGKWTDEDDNSFEEWQRIAPNILEGKGYFVVDVDTTFTQSMKIVHSNTQVFFMVNGQMVEGKFELEQYDERTATFKNKTEANEQITLKKDANSYSVTIEKSKKQAAREKKKKKRTFKRVKE